jgi:hypothetical protein
MTELNLKRCVEARFFLNSVRRYLFQSGVLKYYMSALGTEDFYSCRPTFKVK